MLFDRKRFFDGFRERIDATIEQEQVDGLEFLLGRFETDDHWKDVRHIAYALATVFHETAHSFQPVEEGYYLGSRAKVTKFQKTLRYYPYFGRGYVQLTWPENYETAGEALGIDLIGKPQLALDKNVAFDVLTLGLFRGWFGNKITTHINDKKTDYVHARKCVNAMDKAGLIAGYARSFEKILKDSAAASVSNLPSEPAQTNADLIAPTSAIENAAIQPPIATETKVTEVKTTEESTVATEATVTTPKGDAVDAPPTKVTKNGPLSKWLFSSGGMMAIFTGIWGFIQQNGSVIAVAILVLGMLIFAIIFRQAITDAIRMTSASDPDKNNVT